MYELEHLYSLLFLATAMIMQQEQYNSAFLENREEDKV